MQRKLSGLKVKKSIWLVRNKDEIADIFDALCERLHEQSKDALTCPFVMKHSGIGPITAESYRQRRGDTSLHLSTSVILLGLDFCYANIVGMVRPFNALHYVGHAAGRGGRSMGKGLLWKRSDVENTFRCEP